MGSFCPEYIVLKKYRGVIFHDTEQCCKIWINHDLAVSNIAWGIEWTFDKNNQMSEKLYFDGLFLSKGYVSARKFQKELCVMTLADVKFKRKTG